MDNIELLINLIYALVAALFIIGLKLLSHPDTAKKGNFLSSIGMLLAILVTLLHKDILSYEWIIIGILLGGLMALTKLSQ